MNPDQQVSHVEIYHKLGKLEGLMETMMTTIASFQGAMRDVHARIDNLEARQKALESQQSQEEGANNALTALAKDYALPVAAVVVAWFAGRSQVPASTPTHIQLQPAPGIAQPAPTTSTLPRTSLSR